MRPRRWTSNRRRRSISSGSFRRHRARRVRSEAPRSAPALFGAKSARSRARVFTDAPPDSLGLLPIGPRTFRAENLLGAPRIISLRFRGWLARPESGGGLKVCRSDSESVERSSFRQGFNMKQPYAPIIEGEPDVTFRNAEAG